MIFVYFFQRTKHIVHQETNRCLQSPALDSDNKKIILAKCDPNNKFQKWVMNLQDIDAPVPSWAKIADHYYKKYKDKNLWA